MIMKKMETMNTVIQRGTVAFNSPTKYNIISKEDNEIITSIHIKKGQLKEYGVNGVFVEDLILMCIDQLEHFQNSEFACEENARTLHHLKCALDTTRARQYDRMIRDVQGKMEK